MSADDSLLVQRLRAADTDSLRAEARTLLPPLAYLFALSFAISVDRPPLSNLNLTAPVGMALYYQLTWLFHLTLAVGVAAAVRRGVARHRFVLGVVTVVAAVNLNAAVDFAGRLGPIPLGDKLAIYARSALVSVPLSIVFSVPPIVVGYGIARLLDR
ncbi:hypothetical protein [Halobaculum limi]|uniref:hypothetical protein n=1 Tax=Halobaculum limi TaxID=3031916 RepID=UPI0024059F03|nr:hypothetical protein [Halobaculum sp. YSMS11]